MKKSDFLATVAFVFIGLFGLLFSVVLALLG